MDIHGRAAELVSQMTLEEKASLMSGQDFWRLKGIDRLGLASIMVTDGPHGLRKQVGDTSNANLVGAVPATCFPTASATACSFDRNLMERIGVAIGEECRAEDVAVLLGPGANIKRSPLCGRNFEYISEDPYLAGEIAASLIRGVQSQNVGTSLKHFCANNQETRRLIYESVIDERALQEIYLAGFQRAVRKGKPWTVMCSYNKVLGTYASENKELLTGILRDAWGFQGLVVSDWGATDDRVEGVKAGLDLEMPGTGGDGDRRVAAAVLDGSLDEGDLDICATRVVELILKAQERQPSTLDPEAHFALAREAARESAVLLKNDGILPGTVFDDIAVIGAFAKTPRYQGSGSSKINPVKLSCAFDAFAEAGISFAYADGYRLDGDQPDETLIEEACIAARGKDIVYIFAGLPDAYESEGFDRKDISMPAAHCKLIERVAEVNPNIVVVLSGGSVMDLPWASCARGILMCYLGGEAGGSAAVDLLLGEESPSGHLAESWPLSLEDNPSYAYFPGYPHTVEYRESLYVGYRYYDTARKDVRYPFGFGLSYAEFKYSNLQLASAEVAGTGRLEFSVDITNCSKTRGAEVVQAYVSNKASQAFMPEQELKAFERVMLDAGETKTVRMAIPAYELAYWNVNRHDWAIDGGAYELRIGSSSRHIRLAARFEVTVQEQVPAPDYREKAPCYYDVAGGIDKVTTEQFEALLGHPVPQRERQAGDPFTRNSMFCEARERFAGRVLLRSFKKAIDKQSHGDESVRRMMESMLEEGSLRSLSMAGSKFSTSKVDGVVDMLNGHFFKGLGKVIKG